MEFNPKHLVIINTLTRDEASAFVKFLESECVRHEDDITIAKALINTVQEMFYV